MDLTLLQKVSRGIEKYRIVPLTLPSSHCTNSLSPSSSSTTHPRTNARAGSLSQTYFLPEKSFSPSIPLTLGSLLCISSELMKVGAKVAVTGALLLCELDRIRVELLRDGAW